MQSSDSAPLSPSQQKTNNVIVNEEQPPLQFAEHSYRIVICLLFGFINLINGMCWVTVTPISIIIGDTYNQSAAVVALLPMSYLICYIFVNFPSNWVLDVKGIKKGIIVGSVFTALGTGIRCLVNYSFVYLIIGQFLCAIAQPFILNAPTKIATRWFMPQNRSLALALLSVVNIIGTAIGVVIPTVFVSKDEITEGLLKNSDKATSALKDEFWTLCIFQFCLAIVATLLILIFFTERPKHLPSLSAMAENIDFKESIGILFTSKKFLLLGFAFATVNGSFNIYGSLLDELLDPFGVNEDQISLLGASMMVIGIISATLVGLYVEKTLNYHRVFMILAILGVLQTITFSALLKMEASFTAFLIAVTFMGILFIPILPLGFDYGTDIMFPMGEAQVTGTLMTFGQILGIVFILVSQQIFGLGQDGVNRKQAAFNTSIFIGAFLIVGCIMLAFFNSELKRSKLQSPQIVAKLSFKKSVGRDQQSLLSSKNEENNDND